MNTFEKRIAKIESFVIGVIYAVVAVGCSLYGLLMINTLPVA